MSQIDDARIAEIVDRVVQRLGQVPAAPKTTVSLTASQNQSSVPRGTLGIYGDADTAAQAALRGFYANERTQKSLREDMVRAMREAARRHLKELCVHAVEETGLGRVDDKLAKLDLVIRKTPGPEILRTAAVTGDDGLMLTERAPYGVILAVTPCTNPTETVLCNAIGMVAGGNSVVFNVHPAARRVCNWLVHLLNEAIIGVGGPRDCLVSVEEPTIQSANTLFKHPNVRLVVVTGGPAVVDAAMHSGKKTIGAGPGNPPAIVDETANLANAAKAIVNGASLDNNIVCIAEKEIVAVDSIADDLRHHLCNSGALLMSGQQVRDLEGVVLKGDGVNKDYVGKDASVIASQIGLRGHGSDLRILLCEVDEGHPFVQHELLMPVLPMVRVPNITEAMATAVRVEHGFHHTALMHSTNIENLSAFARVCNCSIFVKNEACYAGLGLGGEGYTSFTIASPTGEGLTTAIHFTRERRCTLKESFRFV